MVWSKVFTLISELDRYYYFIQYESYWISDQKDCRTHSDPLNNIFSSPILITWNFFWKFLKKIWNLPYPCKLHNNLADNLWAINGFIISWFVGYLFWHCSNLQLRSKKFRMRLKCERFTSRKLQNFGPKFTFSALLILNKLPTDLGVLNLNSTNL